MARTARVIQLVDHSSAIETPLFGTHRAGVRVCAKRRHSPTGAGVIITILDTSVDGTHSDLFPLIPGWNFYDDNSNTSDINGHGTAVAGTVAAASSSTYGLTSEPRRSIRHCCLPRRT